MNTSKFGPAPICFGLAGFALSFAPVPTALATVWESAACSFSVRAVATGESPFDDYFITNGGNSIGAPLSDSRNAGASGSLDGGDGSSTAGASAGYAASGSVLSLNANSNADVDPGDFMIAGTASGEASVIITFTLVSGGSYRIIDGNFSGTHASSFGSLAPEGGDPILSFDSLGDQPNGQEGLLGPGTYTLSISADSFSSFQFFNGLFAGSSCTLDIEILTGAPCPGDLNNDNQVDDSDFTVFVAAYNILDCADPAMPAGCPADLNGDGVVDDADFIVFVGAYNDLVCP